MATRNKLTIYLIKDEYADDDNKILSESKSLLGDIPGVGRAYYQPSSFSAPSWLQSFFGSTIETESIFSANARVVLIVRIAIGKETEKTFAITMGYGKNMLAENVVEDDFGLKVVLNTIAPNSLRRINKINIGGNLKASNEQLPLKSEIDDFGFDVDRDLIGTITGCADDEEYCSGMITGGDMLSLTAEVDVSNIVDFLEETYRRYLEEGYKINFAWIDHIKKVKDTRVIDILNTKITEAIIEGSKNVWMAVPDVINWEGMAGFKYRGKEIFDDIYISEVISSFKAGFKSVEQLKEKRIQAISSSDNTTIFTSWSAYRCLCGEIELDDKAFCINNGRWFCIDKDYVSQINRDYAETQVCERPFIGFTNNFNTENDYSLEFAKTYDGLLCMDKNNIPYGGGRSKIELCDILANDATYIHIKPYSGSATLSHLFNQAAVSAELVISDAEFRIEANKAIRKITDDESFLVTDECRPSVIFGIITKHDEPLPPIPFFSKVALRYIKKRLETLGCKVYIKNIRKMD